MSRRLLLSQLHFYFDAPKSRSSFVANIRYIVYDCSSSIGQRCAGSIFAIPNIGHHSAIVPLLALYRRSFCHSILYLYSIVLLWFHATIVLAHSSLLRLNLSLMIGIAFLGYLSDNLADLPTAHCRLYTLSVVIPHLWVLSFTQRSLIPRIFCFRLKPLVATFHTCTCWHFLRRFLPWRYTSEYICNTNFLCRFWYTAPCCCDIRNSPSEVSMPFRAKGQDKFIQKSSSCREYCLQ